MKKQSLAAIALSAVAVLGLGGTAINAWADTTTPTPTPGQTATAQPTGQQSQGPREDRGPRGTEVTGDEATKVGDAVKAKDSAFTVERVMKETDGTYRVMGTKDGARAMYEVSADLQTVTEDQRGPGNGKGPGEGMGPSQDTPVTGDEATKVIAAVNAKFPGGTLTEVRKDPDGSYDVLGTKADGTKVMYEVSADLATVTEGQGGPMGGEGRGRGRGQMGTEVTGDEATKVGDAVKAKFAGVTVQHVMKQTDGTYHVGTLKADGSRAMYTVSADLQTVTEFVR